MNKYIFLASLLTLFGFKDSENVVFKSNDGKTKIKSSKIESWPRISCEISAKVTPDAIKYGLQYQTDATSVGGRGLQTEIPALIIMTIN